MEKTTTDAQQKAIDTRDRTLLVSAAAGSGKTFTLIRRVIESVIKNRNSIDRLLIVTFTRATAAELRERVANALAGALENATSEDDRAFLSAQLALLPGAKISTIDSFCIELVRQNATVLGLSPAFRIADEAESRLTEVSVMDALIEECYAGESETFGLKPEDFLRLSETLYGVGRDGNLADELLGLFYKLINYTRGVDALFDCAAKLREDAGKDFFLCDAGRQLRKELQNEIDYYKAGYENLLQTLYGATDPEPECTAFFEQELNKIILLSAAQKEGYDAFCKQLATFDFPNLKNSKAPALKGQVTTVRKTCKDGIQKLQKFYVSPQKVLSDCQNKTADLVDTVRRLLTEFEQRVRAEKKRKGFLTFNDVSHYALQLLVDENGNDTPLALAKKEAFDAIYIDEYQDVNAIQDRIFRALSNGKNRFVVGDIKQSIYGFRGANPMIFAGMRKTFAPIDQAAPGAPASLFMSENFRCSQEIIDFTNRLFNDLMPKISPDINYQKENDALVHGKKTKEFHVPVKLTLCEKAPNDQPSVCREAEYIAGEIERLVREETKQDGSSIKYGDILILLRSMTGKDKQIITALSARGIPVSAESKSDLLAASEVRIALCLLGVIDNPRNDTALCGLLLSPLCGVSPDYLALLRKNRGSDRLYTSIRKDLANGDAGDENRAKIRALFDEIAQFRALARYASAADLFDEVCERFGLLSRIAGKNPTRRANLELLRNLAAGAGESGSTLADFMRFIKSIEENGKNQPNAAPPSAVGGAVRVMTVHHSKGLEAPVVFFADTQKKYNENDVNKPKLFYDEETGFALKLRDSSNYYAYNHLPFLAVRQKIRINLRRDELRDLYVALTRARERLYVTAELSNPADFANKAKIDSRIGVPYAAYKQDSLLSLILQVIAADLPDDLPFGEPVALYPDCEFRILPYAPPHEAASAAESEVAAVLPDEELEKALRAHFDCVYPHPEMTEIPAKLSISLLYPGILDDKAEGDGLTDEKLPKALDRPAFLSGDADTAAARGTATHLFMQFFDFERAKADGVPAEIARLTERGFLTPHDASLVEVSEVETFLRSPLFAEMCAAKAIYREQRFNLPLPAAAFTEDPARQSALRGHEIFVQGVIDCFFVDKEDKIVLIDYKTDRLPQKDAAAEELLRARHTKQLSYYAAAIEKICGKAPRSVLIYSLALGRTVGIEPIPLA